jgi:hypothetical protein
MHSGGDFMFARRLVPALPFLLLALEAMLALLGGLGSLALSAALLVATCFPHELYPAAPIRLHGVANEKAFYPPELMETRKLQGKLAGAALAGRPVKAAFAGGMCSFAYASQLPYLVEPNGLTNMTLARAKLEQRGPLVGHEKVASRSALRALGLELLFHKTEVPIGPPAFDQLFFGNELWAEILFYDDRLMDSLSSSPLVRFQPIQASLEQAAKDLAGMACAPARRKLAVLDDFYLRSHPAARAPLAELVDERCCPGSVSAARAPCRP